MVPWAATKRLLAAACLVLGFLLLSVAGLLAVREHLRREPPSHTAGGAIQPIDLCRRSTPPDVGAACLAEQERLLEQARTIVILLGALGIGSLLCAALLTNQARELRRKRGPHEEPRDKDRDTQGDRRSLRYRA